MKGKNQRSTIHKANGEAAARIAELEAEVERLRDVENVGLLHVKALGEIERLTGRLLELETTARDAERAVERYQASLDRIRDLTTVIDRRGAAIEKAIEWRFRSLDRGSHPLDVCAEVGRMLGLVVRESDGRERCLWDKSHGGARGLNSAAGRGELTAGNVPKFLLGIIDSDGGLTEPPA